MGEPINANDELHGEKQLAVVLDQLTEAHEVRVVRPAGDAELALDAFRRASAEARQDLERYLAAVLAIVRGVHDAHTASTEKTAQFETLSTGESRHPHG